MEPVMTPKQHQKEEKAEHEQEHEHMKRHQNPRCFKWEAWRASLSNKDKQSQQCCQASGREVRIIHLQEGECRRIFYVGKGQGDRIDKHEKEAGRSYLENAKLRVIREIWAAGGKVVKKKVFETAIEQDANKYEQQLIAQCNKHYLVNRTKGSGPAF